MELKNHSELKGANVNKIAFNAVIIQNMFYKYKISNLIKENNDLKNRLLERDKKWNRPNIHNLKSNYKVL